MSKDNRDGTEPYFVAIDERRAPADALATQVGPVLAAEIFERHMFAVDDDACMAAGDAGHVEANVSVITDRFGARFSSW